MFPPGWNSLETVSKLYRVFSVLGILLVVLGGILGFFAYLYGNRKEHLVAAEQKVLTEQQQQEFKEVKKKHDKEIAETNAKLQTAIKAEKEVTARLAEFEQEQAPRRLTREQKEKLFGLLSQSPEHAVTGISLLGDAEGKNYPEDFDSVLRKANWKVPGVVEASFDRDPIGLWIFVNDAQSLSPGAKILFDSLKAADVQVGGPIRQREEPELLQFRVGQKPK